MTDQPDDITEPGEATVDDWFGQNVARDQEVADRVADQTDGDEEAEARFEAEADGKDRFEAGHQRPAGIEAEGDAVGRKP